MNSKLFRAAVPSVARTAAEMRFGSLNQDALASAPLLAAYASTSRIISTSTGIWNGSEPMPTAERAPSPASPNTS